MATQPMPSGAGEPSPPPAAPASEPKPVTIKPIPEKRAEAKPAGRNRIPGVTRRGDASELFGKVSRDDKGKFTKLFGESVQFEDDDAESLEGADDGPEIHDGPPGEVAPERPKVKASPSKTSEDEPAKPAKPGEPAPETAKPKVKFADKEYDDLSSAEQEVRSLRGMFKPLAEKAQNYDRLLQDQREDRQAALEWTDVTRKLLAGSLSSEDAAKLRQQLGVAEGGAASKPTQPSGSVEALTKGIDMKMFEDLAVHPDGGLQVAAEYLAEEIMKQVKDTLLPSVTAQHQAALQPLIADREQQARSSQLDGLLAQVGSYKLGNGQVAFPELSDPAAIDEIAKVMVEFGRDERDLITPQGVMQAVALYRMAQGFNTPAPSGGAQPVGSGAGAVPVPAPAALASLGADSRGNGAGASGTRHNPAHAGVTQAFDSTRDRLETDFGFRRNPRVVD